VREGASILPGLDELLRLSSSLLLVLPQPYLAPLLSQPHQQTLLQLTCPGLPAAAKALQLLQRGLLQEALAGMLQCALQYIRYQCSFGSCRCSIR